MRIWNNISEFNSNNTVVTVGSFDGVHLGHMQMLKQLNELSKKNKSESLVFTFSPHPVRILNPDKNFVLLTTIEEKIDLFRQANIDHLVIFPFTKEFSKISYSDFVRTVLINQLNMKSILVGYDNKIGRNREGNFDELVKLSKELGFNIQQQKQININDDDLSSSNIRQLLNNGKLLEASKLLGYPYMISGKVVHGQQLGNKLGFPTANILPPENKFIPVHGVYAITIKYKDKNYLGMMNIGVRPTIEDHAPKPTIEAHLFDFNEKLYDEWIQISIVRKLRDEYKFESVDALRTQLKKDKIFAIETLHKEFGK